MEMNSWLKMPMNAWLPTTWYGGFLQGLPDLCVGKLPAAFEQTGLGDWKVWIVETAAERAALTDALSKPVPLRAGAVDFASGPDATVCGIDTLRNYEQPMVALYMPPDPGWPWITLFRLPSVAAAGAFSSELGRGIYSYEVDSTEKAAIERVAHMQAMTITAGLTAEIVTPDRRHAQ